MTVCHFSRGETHTWPVLPVTISACWRKSISFSFFPSVSHVAVWFASLVIFLCDAYRYLRSFLTIPFVPAKELYAVSPNLMPCFSHIGGLQKTMFIQFIRSMNVFYKRRHSCSNNWYCSIWYTLLWPLLWRQVLPLVLLIFQHTSFYLFLLLYLLIIHSLRLVFHEGHLTNTVFYFPAWRKRHLRWAKTDSTRM